ncbi:hypothetical protein T484DRAFT_1826012 [Baffinella frigidus]|nr:hypothetical protein T484DRAFT_1826012 [Cryptophyta sp. CCMP2293]
MKLEREKEAKLAVLQEAAVRVENGEPPTDDAEREWLRMERKREARYQMVERAQEEARATFGDVQTTAEEARATFGDVQTTAEEARATFGDVQTTAVPRPNAYLPEQIALPRPYGATTAVPRPNAYLPEQIALPRPYGAMAPFKPSEPGSTMRHTVKPQPREIEI